MKPPKFLHRDVPVIPLPQIEQAAQACFGIEGVFQPQHSERDQSFRITDASGGICVLKISNAVEDPEVIDLQVSALRHIEAQDPELPVPRVIPTLGGDGFTQVTFEDGSVHLLRALSFLPGVPMEDVCESFGAATRQNIGAMVARLDIALRGFFHPGARQEHPWDLTRCPNWQPYARHIADRAARRDVEAVLDRMARIVLPAARGLRHQVIHQDAHGGNVLLDPRNHERITGLIDFGDMIYGPLVAEIAVAADCLTTTAGDTLDSVGDIAAGYDALLPLDDEEIDLLYDFVLARNALTAIVVAARAALSSDETAHIESPDPFLGVLEELLVIGRIAAAQRLRKACRFPAYCSMQPGEAPGAAAEDALIARRYRLLGSKTTHFYAKPLHLERGRGPWLYGSDGERYLDCYNNVPQVGHCHPHVAKATARQAATLNTNTRYLYQSVLEYAERLSGLLAPPLEACIFVNSGSEANDVAWQMAKIVTGNDGALIMEDAYHGITDAIRQFSPGHPDRRLPAWLAGLLVPDPYRGRYREDDPAIVEHYAADADRAIAELGRAGHRLAAFMIDPAMCSSGVPDVPAGYLQRVETRVRAAGGLMICDEVQAGFGRMGSWWGHEHHGVRADIVTMGKPVGNGFPLGVVVTSGAILNEFIEATGLFSTFGGNPVACAAGLAVIDVLERENLIERGRQSGDYLRRQIAGLATRQPMIGNVRGCGMLTGLELVTDPGKRSPATAETAQLLELMRERRVLVGSEGRDRNILKLRPPLAFEPKHADIFIEALDDSLSALRRGADPHPSSNRE